MSWISDLTTVDGLCRLAVSVAVASTLATAGLTAAQAAEQRPGRQSSTSGSFHEPRTDAEKALDAILKLADRIPESAWVAVEAPGRDKTKDRLFQGQFSPKLRTAWVNAERKAVRKNCNGTYVDGESCGIDVHPITCAQDAAEKYLYRTASASADQAVVEYRWPEETEPLATYRLVFTNGTWVLDGVACAGYLKFNMP
ncbi:MAG TPA: hypothetical protein VK196_00155 [Magnetospirillum sp.]|nr:hypothetical protein [Magnetospirillum sp.]